MYEAFYGLSELPFELTANSKYLFLTPKQREALSILQYGLRAAKSLTVLIGEAGTGKTTLIRAALESDRCRDVSAIYLDNPTLRPEDFTRLLALKFDLGPESCASKAVFLDRLEPLLRERRARGLTTALVIDEAQSLGFELLEEIRLLANMETPSGKLLPLVVAGQPELGVRLEQPNLRQLKQRVTLRFEIEPFTLKETADFIATRITVAGGVPSRLFTREAVTMIHESAGGIARSVSVICDNALVTAMALGRRTVDRAVVTEVIHDLRVKPPDDTSASAAVAPQDASEVRAEGDHDDAGAAMMEAHGHEGRFDEPAPSRHDRGSGVGARYARSLARMISE